MKRPSKVRVLGRVYEVAFVPADHADLHNDEDAPCLGRANHIRFRLSVNEAQCFQSQQDSLLHEIVHAIEDVMDLPMEESHVKRLAGGILAVIQENPDLVKWLSGRCK